MGFDRPAPESATHLSFLLAELKMARTAKSSWSEPISYGGLHGLVLQHWKFDVLIYVGFQGRPLGDNIVFSGGGDQS